MMRGPRNLLWVVPLVFFLSWPLWRGPLADFLAPPGPGPRPGHEAPSRQTDGGVSFRMEGVHLSRMQNGVEDWRIKAARLWSSADQDRLFLEGVEASFFKGGRRSFLISGKRGDYDGKKRLLMVQGAVRLESAEGYMVRTEELRYDDRTGRILSDNPVMISGKGMEAQSQGGLSYRLDGGDYEAGGRVKVEIH